MSDPSNPWSSPDQPAARPTWPGPAGDAAWPTMPPPAAGWVPPMPARPAAQGSPAGLFVLGAGVLATLVGLVLPYYGVGFGGSLGVEAHVGPLHYGANVFAVMLQVAAVVLTVLNATGALARRVAFGLACGCADLALAIIAIRMFTIPDPLKGFTAFGEEDIGVDVGLRYGAYVLLVGAAVLSAGVLLATLPGGRRPAARSAGQPPLTYPTTPYPTPYPTTHPTTPPPPAPPSWPAGSPPWGTAPPAPTWPPPPGEPSA